MRYTIVALGIGLGLLNVSACRADVADTRAVFQAILRGPNDDLAPISPDLLSKMETDIGAATVDQVQSLLPLGERCLQSSNSGVRTYGLELFLIVSVRLDGSELVGTHVDALAPLLDDSEGGFRRGAIYVLGRSKSPKALVYLAAHLDDTNAPEEARMIAAPLLESGTDEYLRKVLNLVEQRPELKLKSSIIQMFGVYRITTPDALKSIHSGLSDTEAGTRRISLDAIDHMPKDVRSQFAADLEGLITLDPDPGIRERATQVLISSAP